VATRPYGDGAESSVRTGNPRRRAAWACLFLLGLVLATGCGSSGSPGNPTSPTATGTSGSTTTEAAISAPQAAGYMTALVPKLNAVGTAVAAMPSTCDASTMPACQSSLQRIHDANADLEKALQDNTVPGCLREADSELRASTHLLDQATHDGMNSLSGQDLTALQAMSTETEQAAAHQTRAMDLLQHSSC
jgi:hypothetical protein